VTKINISYFLYVNEFSLGEIAVEIKNDTGGEGAPLESFSEEMHVDNLVSLMSPIGCQIGENMPSTQSVNTSLTRPISSLVNVPETGGYYAN
jgi:hypothetical protein